jgi:hypothetical protein
VTTTAGFFLASKIGLITLNPPAVYWISAVLVTVSVMFVLGLGILLLTNLRIYFEMGKNEPEMLKIQKLMKRYVKVVAIRAAMQFVIIFIMAEFATGFFLNVLNTKLRHNSYQFIYHICFQLGKTNVMHWGQDRTHQVCSNSSNDGAFII